MEIFKILLSVGTTDGGDIVTAAKVNNDFFISYDSNDIETVQLEYVKKNVILTAYKE